VGQLEEMYVYDTYGQATVWAWRPGDVNRNGTTDMFDMPPRSVWKSAGSPLADLNEDGIIDYGGEPDLDIQLILGHSGQATPVTYSSLDNPFMFTGRLTDTINDADEPVITEETRFRRIQDNRNRSYDPHHGRWFQRDPLGVRPDAPRGMAQPGKQYRDSMSLLEYCRSKPDVFIDPLGEQMPPPGSPPWGPPKPPLPPPHIPHPDPPANPESWLTRVCYAYLATCEWGYGLGGEEKYFGQNSCQCVDMMNSPGVEQARASFYATNPRGTSCGKLLPYAKGYSFSPIEAGLDPTEQFVGSYNIQITSAGCCNCQCRIKLTLRNTTSMTSAAYHTLPSWTRSTFPQCGNTYQTYEWVEPFPNGCCP
jgi:hypothetical protein